MTVENSHHSTPAEADRRARNLEAVLRVTKTIASSLDLDETLCATCRAAVELLGVSHSSLVLLSPARDQGTVRAEYPELGLRGKVIRFSKAPEGKRAGASAETAVNA